jgi:long-subunit fatty acid transport protein
MEASIIGKFGFGSLDPNYPDFSVNADLSSSINLNFASFVVPFSAGDFKIVGGVAYRKLYDFNQMLEWKFDDGSSFKIDETGGVTAISPAVAFQVNEMLSFGAVVNILGGSWTSEETDFDGEVDEKFSSDFSGTSIDIGVLVKPSPTVSIGANINLPYTLTETNRDDLAGSEDVEFELDVPLFWAVGLVFRATDNLSLAVDYRNRGWSGVEYRRDGMKIEDFELYDSNSFHAGLEYLFEAGNTIIPARLGFYTLPTPASESNAEGRGDQIAYNAATAGLGVVLTNVIIDASFEYIFGSYVGDIDAGQPVDYDLSNMYITLGATLHLGN